MAYSQQKSSFIAEQIFKRLIPGQFGIAFILTLGAMSTAWMKNGFGYKGALMTLEQWQRGFWDGPLMIFTLQMMLILVFGYSIAISPKVYNRLKFLAEIPKTNLQASVYAALVSLIAAWLNWGLGLVAGAIYVRLLGHSLHRRGIPFNYPLLGASGYSGMMIWHGGLSGSAPLKAAETGHLASLVSGDLKTVDAVKVTESLFSSANIFITLLACTAVVGTVSIISNRNTVRYANTSVLPLEPEPSPDTDAASGAEIFEFKKWPAILLSLLIAIYLLNEAFREKSLGFFTPNVVISLLLAAGLWLHGSLRAYMLSIDRTIQSASGVVLLFPFYFGIIGLLRFSGITADVTQWFVSMASSSSFPMFVFFSSAIVNLLIPSGGGQWAVQGPMIVEAGMELGVPIEHVILSFAYGDQLTNMLQPFWAIPLLYITRLKAFELLGYTFFILLAGLLVFSLGILLFF